MKLRITWDVEDGYCGKSRSHSFIFNTEDYVDSNEDWNNLSEDIKNEYINDEVQNQFDQTISWYIKNIQKI